MPNLGDTCRCALCGRALIWTSAGLWDHAMTEPADHQPAPMSAREEGAHDALRLAMDELRVAHARIERLARHALRYRRQAHERRAAIAERWED